MRRRLLAACAALVLALAGTVVLVAYVRGADTRALAGVQTVDVLVVDRLVPAGTAAPELAALIRQDQVPARAAVEGRGHRPRRPGRPGGHRGPAAGGEQLL
ncbi:hypothetical protein A7K94_0220275, partial [Modestobacter sp. VKM Ac-2676]